MRLALDAELRRLEARLPFLATLGSAAPFIGLFGTVWGIMRSFAGIAAANNTSLAVVAPGIAEALVRDRDGARRGDPGGRRLQQDHGRSRPLCRAHARADRALRRHPVAPAVGDLNDGDGAAAFGREPARTATQPLAEINVTPMVDVMLVLLVIFMVTAPLLMVGVPLDLPKTRAAAITAAEGADHPEPRPRRRDLHRRRPGRRRAISKPRLAALAAEDPKRIVYVRGDRTITYAQLMDMLGQVNRAGFAKVSLVAEAAGPK